MNTLKNLVFIIGSVFVAVVDAGGGLQEEEEFEEAHTYRSLYESDDKDDKCGAGCRIAMGIFFILFSPLLIWWNEHAHMRLVKLYKAAQRSIHDLGTAVSSSFVRSNGTYDNNFVNWDHNFVCLNGSIEGGICLEDELFSQIKIPNSLLLVREIDIYQYYETKKDDEDPKLKKAWFKLPQKDPPSFKDNKNPVGNWNLLASTEKEQDTGNKLYGEPITFGDRAKIWRAPHPTVGGEDGTFELPVALMNEAFFGLRHVHRLHELERIKAFQGTWTNLDPAEVFPMYFEVVCDDATDDSKFGLATGRMSCRRDGKYVYDGQPDVVGTIRMTWRYATPQDVTIAAEAVAPGRPCSGSYGSDGLDLASTGACSKMISTVTNDLFEPVDLESDPLLAKTNTKSALVNHSKWTFTPFPVTTKRLFPPYDEKFLGHLWMIAPGIHTSSQLFRKAHAANDVCLWKVRGLSYILLFAGWMLLFTTPVEAVFGRGIFSYILGTALGVAALLISTSCWVTCTALACFTARPARATVAIVLVWAIVVHLHERSSAPTMMGPQ